jgi:hypothetical protein
MHKYNKRPDLFPGSPGNLYAFIMEETPLGPVPPFLLRGWLGCYPG